MVAIEIIETFATSRHQRLKKFSLGDKERCKTSFLQNV